MKHVRRFCISLIAFTAFLAVLCGPAATHLQSRDTWADPAEDWDAVYLVCGARAQDRRIRALCRWIQKQADIRSQKPETGEEIKDLPLPTLHSPLPTILVGNDPQKSLWCRQHQTNHTRTGWAEEKLKAEIGKLKLRGEQRARPEDGNTNISAFCFPISALPRVVPGNFRNTDGEMAALAIYLKAHPEIQSIALTTSRFHGRRLLQRYRKHIGDHPSVGLIPGTPHWENRAPWRVLAEYLKLLRDQLGLTNQLTRPGGKVECGR